MEVYIRLNCVTLSISQKELNNYINLTIPNVEKKCIHYLQLTVNARDLAREKYGKKFRICLSHVRIKMSIRYPRGDVCWKFYTNMKLRELFSTEIKN